MPHFVASDLVVHCLPMSHKKNARLIWIKFLMVTGLLYRGSLMSAHVLLNLLSKLGKRDKM